MHMHIILNLLNSRIASLEGMLSVMAIDILGKTFKVLKTLKVSNYWYNTIYNWGIDKTLPILKTIPLTIT